MNYQESLEFLYSQLPVFHRIGAAAYKPGLDNTLRLMDALDSPQLKFKSIHIAGTNGKGSVSHMLAATFQCSGYKTGLYTSPHLVDFGERIRINGSMINQQFVIEFINNNSNLIKEIKPSFFELTMAMAFSYFAENNVDIAIIETGLGGRLDSTNIICPEVSVITNIGFDHTDFLGNTLEKIAFEKAGIIKKNTPVVVGEFLPETRNVFLNMARKMDAPLIFAQENSKIIFREIKDGKLWFTFKENLFASELTGYYQIKNLHTYFTVIEAIKTYTKFSINSSDIHTAISNVCKLTGLRGRWERIQTNPTIIIDTAHNIDGISQLTGMLKLQQYNNLHIIFGMVQDKDIDSVLAIMPKKASYYFTNSNSIRALNSENLKLRAEKFELPGDAYNCVSKSIEIAMNTAGKDDLILITGSNYVVGESIEYFDSIIA